MGVAKGLLVVGSGPAGVSAAEAFRCADPRSRIQIVTVDPDLPYARPPLSKDFRRGCSEDVALHPAEWFNERGSIRRRTAVSAWTPTPLRATGGARKCMGRTGHRECRHQ